MDSPAAPPTVRHLDPQGLIAADVPCVRCGYNLRGLAPEGVCPECGLEMKKSLHGDLLCFSDPTWVGTLAKGMTWLVRGLNGAILALIVGIVVLVAFHIGAPNSSGPSLIQQGVLYTIGAISVVSFLSAWPGLWWLTSPNPLCLVDQQEDDARLLGRWGIPTAVGLMIVSGGVREFSLPAGYVMSLLSQIALIIGCNKLLTYVGQIGLRMPEADLVRSTRRVRKHLLVVLIAQLCLNMAMLIGIFFRSRTISPPSPGSPPTAGMGVAALAPLATSIVALAVLEGISETLRLFGRYRKHLRETLERTRQNWSERPAAGKTP